MKDIYLTNYSVKGIKTLDELVSLSFYKKTITKNLETQEYNIKGIYGTNGSGKSAIISSVDILRNIITDSHYLSNPLVQENLDEIINKRLKELYIEAEYMVNVESGTVVFTYSVTLSKDNIEKYVISKENLFFRMAASKSESMKKIFEIVNGQIRFLNLEQKQEDFHADVVNRTMNLLEMSSMSSLLYEKVLMPAVKNKDKRKEILSYFLVGTKVLFGFGRKLHVYLDASDEHKEYIVGNRLNVYDDIKSANDQFQSLIRNLEKLDNDTLNVVSARGNVIPKSLFKQYQSTIARLYSFLHIFKSDLKKIEIDKKENKDSWVCDLLMVYDGYQISTEYESTGIKKLIRLFAYIDEMVQGGIVFIDELDSNLHDVYLCALLEYLMEYGQGQLCFTTHNVGPMDVLKRNKKSIDFLSDNHMIYPWRTNGNYSPSKLYRSGMIEGSPFNVDLTDFISVFGSGAEDE